MAATGVRMGPDGATELCESKALQEFLLWKLKSLQIKTEVLESDNEPVAQIWWE